jgi:microcystin-dependent protein
MWSGTIATIPTGWVLCNGSNGTPDLRDRFIVGAKQDDSGVAKTNVTGSLTQSGNGSVPQHSHGITGLSIANESAHTHTIGIIADGIGSLGALTASAHDVTAKVTSAGSAHTHALSGSIDNYGTGSTNIAIYYALAFIMKS